MQGSQQENEGLRQEKRQRIKVMFLNSSPQGAGAYPVGTELRIALAPEGREPGVVYTTQLVVYRC